MSIEDRLRNVPGSYDDFVNDTLRWMQRDSKIKDAIEKQLQINPDSNTDDLTLILWECLGIGSPLEIVDEADTEKKRISVAML